MRWNRKRSISKITETACLSGWEFEAHKSRYGVHVTRHWNWMNSYWMFWIGCLRGARSEQFLQFSKNDLLWFNLIFLIFDMRKSCVFQIFLSRRIKAYLCPNIINFDSVDFSERRPEEVISFFWRSVYIRLKPTAQSLVKDFLFGTSTMLFITKTTISLLWHSIDSWGSTVIHALGLQSLIRGSRVQIPLSAHFPRQGILSTIVSLDPGVVNGYPAGIYSL